MSPLSRPSSQSSRNSSSRTNPLPIAPSLHSSSNQPIPFETFLREFLTMEELSQQTDVFAQHSNVFEQHYGQGQWITDEDFQLLPDLEPVGESDSEPNDYDMSRAEYATRYLMRSEPPLEAYSDREETYLSDE